MPWFSIQARDDNPRHAHVVIDKPIGSDWAPDWISDLFGELPARELIAAVDALGELDDIDVELNTPGGDVASGVRIYHYFRNHRAKIHTRVTGMAASIGTIIMMAGDTRSMAMGTTIMTHRASALICGAYNVSELEEVGNNLKKVDASMIDIYAAVTGKPKDEIAGLLDQGDTYLTAEEALEWGFATEADPELRAVAAADPKPYFKQLAQAAKLAQAEAQAALAEAKVAQLEGKGGATTMTAAEALALAFDITPEEAEAQAADLGDRVLALINASGASQVSAKAVAEPLAKALGVEVQAVLDDPKSATDRLVTESGALAVKQDHERFTAILKSCETTGQMQLLHKLVINLMPEQQASEYILDVAAAGDDAGHIFNGHSPEGGHKKPIDYQKIYDRQNRRPGA